MTDPNQSQSQGSLLRSVLGVIAGVVGGFVLMMAIQFASSRIYSMPAEVDQNDVKAIKSWFDSQPAAAQFTMLLLVVVSDATGTFAGAWLAASIARRAELLHGMIVGVLFLIGGIANLIVFPIHPVWFAIVDLAIYLPAAFFAVKCVPSRFRPKQPATPV